jgi:hypothetical protein
MQMYSHITEDYRNTWQGVPTLIGG